MGMAWRTIRTNVRDMRTNGMRKTNALLMHEMRWLTTMGMALPTMRTNARATTMPLTLTKMKLLMAAMTSSMMVRTLLIPWMTRGI